jgi:hypothetical protein
LGIVPSVRWLTLPTPSPSDPLPNLRMLVGTWRLASYESRDSAGAVQYPFGQGVIGQLTYDADGNMSAMLMKPNRLPFASHDMRRGTDPEVRDAFEGFIAYYGRYTVDPAKQTVIHHVRGASYPYRPD